MSLKFSISIKFSILTGAVAFTVTGIAVASQDKGFFSTHNPLSTISDLVSTSFGNTNTSATPELGSTNNKHASATPPPSQILHNISNNISTVQPVNKSAYVPNANFQLSEYNPVNSSQTVVDYGNTGNNSSTVSSPSGNSFVDGLGGGTNWGPTPGSAGVIYLSGGGFGGLAGGGTGLSSITPSTWTLSSNGTLTYSVSGLTLASPAPELGEWLLMLFGLGLVGFVATLRKQRSMETISVVAGMC